MGLLDFFKKGKKDKAASAPPEASRKPEEKGKLLKKKEEKKEEKKELVKPSQKDTKDAYKILLKPLVTEKATQTNTYLFAVDAKTNKQEVGKAVEAVYGVKPVKVNITNYSSKKVRWGRTSGQTKAWKKAVVYLKPD